MNEFENILKFDFDKSYGYITVNPLLIGAGMDMTFEVNLNDRNKLNEKNLNLDEYKLNNTKFYGKCYMKLETSNTNEFIDKTLNQIANIIEHNVNFNETSANNSKILKVEKINDPFILQALNLTDNISSLKNKNDKTLENLVTLVNNKEEILFEDQTDYDIFSNFVSNYLKVSENFENNENYDFESNEKEINFKDFPLVSNADAISSICFTFIRNFNNFPFSNPKNTNNNQNAAVEKNIYEFVLANEEYKYFSFENNKEEVKKLKEENNLIVENNSSHKLSIIKFKENIFGVVNDVDNLKIELVLKDKDFINHLNELVKLEKELNNNLNFAKDKRFGYLTSNPSNCGLGLVITFTISLSHLKENKSLYESLIANQPKTSYKLKDNDNLIEITMKSKVCDSFSDIYSRFLSLINELNHFDLNNVK